MKRVGRDGGLYIRDGQYRIDFQYRGKRFCRLAGPSIEGARTMLYEMRRRARLEAEGVGDNRYPLKDLYAEYLADRRQQLRAGTVVSYEHSFAAVWGFFRQALVSDVRPEQVAEYIRRRRGDGAADSTINREICLLKAVFRFGERMGRIAGNPIRSAAGIEKPARGFRRAMERAEFEKLLAHRHPHGAKGDRPCTCRDLWIVLGETGLRLGELVHLPWDHVDLAARTIRVEAVGEWEPKTREATRTVWMTKRVWEVMARRAGVAEDGLPEIWAELQGDAGGVRAAYLAALTAGRRGEVVFPRTRLNVRRRFLACVRAAGIDDRGLTLHSLRHSLCSWLIQAGQSPKTVQRILGHANVATTMNVYSHVMRGDEQRAMGVLDGPVVDVRRGFQLAVSG